MTLEMITREPLEVPMLRDEYWATFAGKSPLDLARILRFVQQYKTDINLPLAEDQNIRDCLAAWQNTGLGA
jgi:hypothetical protein